MSIEERVLAIIRANVEPQSDLTLTSDLRRELHLDSFGTLMIINAIEDAFGMTFEEADFARVNTPAEVAALLRSKYHLK